MKTIIASLLGIIFTNCIWIAIVLTPEHLRAIPVILAIVSGVIFIITFILEVHEKWET